MKPKHHTTTQAATIATATRSSVTTSGRQLEHGREDHDHADPEQEATQRGRHDYAALAGACASCAPTRRRKPI